MERREARHVGGSPGLRNDRRGDWKGFPHVLMRKETKFRSMLKR